MIFLQARIAFLQGERKGQENLKHDLIRRIKMLEYALKQERYQCLLLLLFTWLLVTCLSLLPFIPPYAYIPNQFIFFFSCRAKYHRLKYGTEVSPEKMSKEEENVNQEAHRDGNTNNTKPVVNWRQGRQLLRQ